MDVEAKHFYWACCVAFLGFAFSLSFGNCDQSGSYRRYKVCMETTHDLKACDPDHNHETKPILTPSPAK